MERKLKKICGRRIYKMLKIEKIVCDGQWQFDCLLQLVSFILLFFASFLFFFVQLIWLFFMGAVYKDM